MVTGGFLENIILGEAITAPAMIYIDPTGGKAFKAVATDTAKSAQAVLLVSGAADDQRQAHWGPAVIEWPSALTPGDKYYLGDTDGAVSAAPGTNEQFIGDVTSNGLFSVNIAPVAAAGGGSVATDAIWDAKGDLAVGTGSDAAAKLSIGADGKQIYADAAQSTGLRWGPSIITPSTITSSQNNYSPTDWSKSQIINISGDASFNAITSFEATFSGDVKKIINVGDSPILIQNEHTSGTAANRVTGLLRDFVLHVGASIELFYDGTASRWRLIGQEAIFPYKTKRFCFNESSPTLADYAGVQMTPQNSGTLVASSATTTVPSSVQLATGVLSNGGYFISLIKSTYFTTFGLAHTRFSSLISVTTLSDATDTFTVESALSEVIAALAANNSIGFRYTHSLNGGNWTAFCKDSAGGETTVDSGAAVVADKLFTLDIAVNKANTEARFFIDTVLVATITANMPANTVLGAKTHILKSAGTSSRRMKVFSMLAEAILP